MRDPFDATAKTFILLGEHNAASARSKDENNRRAVEMLCEVGERSMRAQGPDLMKNVDAKGLVAVMTDYVAARQS